MRMRAAQYLWAQQAEDGGWHSETYGLLRSGQSLTPFLLDALLTVPASASAQRAGAVRRALAFLVAHVDEQGALGLARPGVPDYPTYATALGLRLVRTQLDRPALADRMRDRLLALQFRSRTGWPPDHPAHGAWGMGSMVPHPPHAGHLDVSMTRFVLEALAGEEGEAAERARVRARIFLARLRSEEGGYFFTTVMAEKNKAGRAGNDSWRGYGTSTADAILSLRATHMSEEDPALLEGRRWLVAHHRADLVPGFPADERGGWALSMEYYYRAAAARVLAGMGVREAPAGRDWRAALVDAFALEQRPDGRFVNRGALMKEDDPLIATALALRALSAVLAEPLSR